MALPTDRLVIGRRALLRSSLLIPVAGALAACGTSGSSSGSSASPTLIRNRPTLTHGIASGDPRTDGALVWARSDNTAKMIVETSATESFANTQPFEGPQLTPDTDGTGRLRITGLEPGQTVHYRVTLEGDDGATSEPVAGVFRTAPNAADAIRFVWSGDVVGQGWGINEQIGGMSIFGAMADRQPHFFIHSGDAIYADNPVPETQKQNDGGTYRSVTAPAKDHPAQDLASFRGSYAYNLTDNNYVRFNSSMPQLIQWDDHEVINNWFPGESLAGQNRKGYTENDVNTLAGMASQAWREWQPTQPTEAVDGRVYRKVSYGPLLDVFVLDMRTYKNPNTQAWADSDDAGILGAAQTQWLIDGLKSSTATWKVVANDLPISIVVPDASTNPPQGPPSMEAVAQGENGRPLGREIAFSRILSSVKDVRNVVFLTADVHYTAAISYHPDRAGFADFAPFWEFVAGPLNAGAFPQSPLDGTFGAQYEFVHAPDKPNASPAEGFQHFGEVEIDKDSRALTVNLRDAKGASLYSKTLTV